MKENNQKHYLQLVLIINDTTCRLLSPYLSSLNHFSNSIQILYNLLRALDISRAMITGLKGTIHNFP